MVKVIRWISKAELRQTVKKIIANDGVIVYPTDTVYGLGANPFSKKAVEKVFSIKKRSKNKPIPLLISRLKYLKKIAFLNKIAKKLIKKFWPGQLTLVLKRKNVPDWITCGHDKVGVRIPNHKLCIFIIESCGGILTGTSANLSGKKTPASIKELSPQIFKRVDLVIDAGPCPVKMPSTVVDVLENGVKILREGPVSKKDIEKALKFSF